RSPLFFLFSATDYGQRTKDSFSFILLLFMRRVVGFIKDVNSKRSMVNGRTAFPFTIYHLPFTIHGGTDD
ncbi:MAG: hypothetical protein WBP93_08860, partial [Pyrinomonadaceae bacterium]